MQRNSKSVQVADDRPIVLVGMMGAGKSTIGRRLAARLGLAFVDADDEIEAAAGMSISDIFSHLGEDAFRDGERRVISRLVREGRRVIATGGGAFMNPETRKLILDHAVTVWLDADVDILVERVSRRDDRPLLKGKDARTVILELANTRNPVYAEADIHVRSGEGAHETTVDRIIQAIEA